MKPEYPKLTQVHKNLGKCAILPSLFLFTLISEEILKKICDYEDLIKVLNESQIELKTLQTESNR